MEEDFLSQIGYGELKIVAELANRKPDTVYKVKAGRRKSAAVTNAAKKYIEFKNAVKGL